ncbi:MAG TPA: BON domain-containing protein [Chthonomonadaceae bacterium]|nr:BON domain-containing protein [Chthonomonadaceae bacterium]
MKTLIALGAALLLLGTGLAGCRNTAEGLKEDTAKNVHAASQAVERAAKKVDQETNKHAPQAKQGASNAGQAITLTPTVKTAIVADSKLNDSRNNIDVDSANNVVHLKGHVVNSALKQHATDVAVKALQKVGSNAKVSNELAVQKP